MKDPPIHNPSMGSMFDFLGQRRTFQDHVLHHLHQLTAAVAKLEESDRQILKGLHKMAGELDRLTASVAAENTVIDSAVELLGQLAQMIRDLPANAAAIAKLADDVDAKKDALAAAVTANTPAA